MSSRRHIAWARAKETTKKPESLIKLSDGLRTVPSTKLIRGKLKNFVKCINVNFTSERIEDFYDLSMNVRGCKNLRESFEKYIEREKLDGDNKYMAEGHGLQDAEKGCAFVSFPPVLHLHLKRFEYDPIRDANVKINDRFEFDEEIDLAPYLEEDPGHPEGPRD